MTGQLITSDHKTYTLPSLLRWEIVYTGSVPCDSYSVTFLYDASMAEPLHLAAGFAAVEGGDIMLRGIVDEYTVELTAEGLTATVTGRGYAARLLDNESRPLTYQGATLAEIVRNHVTPYGIQCEQLAAVAADSVDTVAAGSSQWKALANFCETYGGFTPRFQRDGKLLAVPETDSGRRLVIGGGDAGFILYAAGGPLRRPDGSSGDRQDSEHRLHRVQPGYDRPGRPVPAGTVYPRTEHLGRHAVHR